MRWECGEIQSAIAVFSLRPEGPTFNSHAREGVVAIVSINLEARRAGTPMPCEIINSCLCRTCGAHS